MRDKLVAWLTLLRLSNVLTPVADVWMGVVVMTGTLAPAATTAALTTASVCLYLSGMVLNDVFDAEQDARERPERPIPAGSVLPRHAQLVGWGLMIAGLIAAGVASKLLNDKQSLAVGVALAVCILLYDCVLKRTFAGPFAMGMCRGLNVLLGMAAFGPVSHLKSAPQPPVIGWFLVGGMLLYITGLTCFARNEASQSKRQSLASSALISMLGLALLATAPWLPPGLDYPPRVPTIYWTALWGVVALFVGRRYALAILQPTPRHVQSAVGNAIQSIILIDAALAWGYAGQFWGLAILALWPLTMLLARFIPQT